MQQSINQLEEFYFDLNLSEIQKVEFRFVQGDTVRDIVWPDDEQATAINDHVITVEWLSSDTAKFEPGYYESQARITVKDSEYQPETKIVPGYIEPSLFGGLNG